MKETLCDGNTVALYTGLRSLRRRARSPELLHSRQNQWQLHKMSITPNIVMIIIDITGGRAPVPRIARNYWGNSYQLK
jgi:hypothetical protein